MIALSDAAKERRIWEMRRNYKDEYRKAYREALKKC